MKTVCLIRDAPALRWFVNRIHRTHNVALAVVEAPPVAGRVLDKLRQDGAVRLTRDIVGAVNRRIKPGPFKADWNRFFGDDWQTLEPTIQTLFVEDINGDDVFEKLSSISPDLILDHGTSLVKDRILETADLALNLHWGLSPYYRGTFCTEWALINHDPYNIGVTVHRLAKVIDGGDVLGQARADLSPDDTVNSINMKLTVLGTEILVQAMADMLAERQLEFHPQNISQGYLTRNKQFTPTLAKHVEELLAGGGLESMLARPARRERLPIISLPE